MGAGSKYECAVYNMPRRSCNIKIRARRLRMGRETVPGGKGPSGKRRRVEATRLMMTSLSHMEVTGRGHLIRVSH